MPAKKYKKIYCIYKSRYYNETVTQVCLVRETKKTYFDITHSFFSKYKRRERYGWKEAQVCLGRFLKSEEYVLNSTNYTIYMFGSDLEMLKSVWNLTLMPKDKENFSSSCNIFDNVVAKLNNGEESEEMKGGEDTWD